MSDLIDKTPPQSLEGEQAVLGAMLLDENARVVAGHILDASCFTVPAHAALFDVLVGMTDRAVPVDHTLLREALRKSGQLETVDKQDQYLITLADSVPTASNAEYYARIVRDKARLRDLIHAASDLIREAHDPAATADELSDRFESKVMALSDRQRESRETPAERIVSELQTLLEKGEGLPWGMKTYLPDLDDKLHGFRPGNLIIIAARPRMGKSALCLNLAEGLARAGCPVGFFSLEMSNEEVAVRLLSARSEVELWNLEKGQISQDKMMRQLHETALMFAGLPLYLDDTPALRILDLRSRVRRMVLNRKIEIVFVDYLQLIRGERQRQDNREQEVAGISRGLKALARECHIAVVAACALSRQAEEQAVPRLSTLRESGALEQDADVVLILHKPDDTSPVFELAVAKHRNGPTGIVKLTWRKDITKFDSYKDEPREVVIRHETLIYDGSERDLEQVDDTPKPF